MSTILDALRKVEGERRASGPSPRERLVSFPQVTPPPSRKGVWVIGAVLMGVGFAGGVGLALFGSGPMTPIPVAQPAPVALTPTEQPSVQPAASPSDPPAAIAAASHPPEEPGSGGAGEQGSQGVGGWRSGGGIRSPLHPSTSAPLHTQEGLQELSLAGSPLLATVRRSPFAVSKERYESERQPYEQPRDTLDPQVPSPSFLGTPNRDNKPSSRRHPFPQPRHQRESLKVSLNLLQWSPEVERRRAVISVNGGPMLAVHEGDTVSNLTVERILPNAVELRFSDSTTVELRLGDPNFVVKPRPSSSSPAPLAP